MNFDLQLFCGGTKVINQPAQVAPASEEQKRMEKITADYAEYIAPTAYLLANYGTEGFKNNQINPQPNWNQMYQTGAAQLTQNQNKMSDLLQGKLDPEFQKNMENSIKSSIQNIMGTTLNDLSQRGVINSSIMNKANDQLQKNIADTMAQNYTQNLATQSQLLNQANQQVYQPINFAGAAQNSSIDIPAKYYALATGQTAPATDAWKTYMSQQTALSSPAQSYAVQKSGFLGGLMSGLGSYFCFVAGTMIATPDGDKPIEEIKLGDKVLSLNENGEIVIETVIYTQEPTISDDQYIEIITNKTSVTTTHTQPFLIKLDDELDEMITADQLIHGDVLIAKDGVQYLIDIVLIDDKEPVYDLATTGRNIYFANGLAVEGRKL